mmetsp:Transcript_39922/g.98702  ORF Transcript_39922/g.98702 Transcript_39922/m.98702 type:complete len:242 (+) Transcript_39922:277-1002(+)
MLGLRDELRRLRKNMCPSFAPNVEAMSANIICLSASTVAIALRASNAASTSSMCCLPNFSYAATKLTRSEDESVRWKVMPAASRVEGTVWTTSYRHHTLVRQTGAIHGSSTITTDPIRRSISPMRDTYACTLACGRQKTSIHRYVLRSLSAFACTKPSIASISFRNEHPWAWLTKCVALLTARLPSELRASRFAAQTEICAASSKFEMMRVGSPGVNACASQKSRRKHKLTPSKMSSGKAL